MCDIIVYSLKLSDTAACICIYIHTYLFHILLNRNRLKVNLKIGFTYKFNTYHIIIKKFNILYEKKSNNYENMLFFFLCI